MRKNRLVTLTLAALLLWTAAACGGGGEPPSPAQQTEAPAVSQTAEPAPEATPEPTPEATPAPEPLTPEEVYQAIAAVAAFPGMVEMADPYLLDNIGVKPEQYTDAVYYLVEQGTDPDEIVIVSAVDDAAAQDVQAKLEQWLARRIDGAQSYLAENLPILEAGVVRRDGNTVALLITSNIDGVQTVYDSLVPQLP